MSELKCLRSNSRGLVLEMYRENISLLMGLSRCLLLMSICQYYSQFKTYLTNCIIQLYVNLSLILYSNNGTQILDKTLLMGNLINELVLRAPSSSHHSSGPQNRKDPHEVLKLTESKLKLIGCRIQSWELSQCLSGPIEDSKEEIISSKEPSFASQKLNSPPFKNHFLLSGFADTFHKVSHLSKKSEGNSIFEWKLVNYCVAVLKYGVKNKNEWLGKQPSGAEGTFGNIYSELTGTVEKMSAKELQLTMERKDHRTSNTGEYNICLPWRSKEEYTLGIHHTAFTTFSKETFNYLLHSNNSTPLGIGITAFPKTRKIVRQGFECQNRTQHFRRYQNQRENAHDFRRIIDNAKGFESLSIFHNRESNDNEITSFLVFNDDRLSYWHLVLTVYATNSICLRFSHSKFSFNHSEQNSYECITSCKRISDRRPNKSIYKGYSSRYICTSKGFEPNIYLKEYNLQNYLGVHQKRELDQKEIYISNSETKETKICLKEMKKLKFKINLNQSARQSSSTSSNHETFQESHGRIFENFEEKSDSSTDSQQLSRGSRIQKVSGNFRLFGQNSKKKSGTISPCKCIKTRLPPSSVEQPSSVSRRADIVTEWLSSEASDGAGESHPEHNSSGRRPPSGKRSSRDREALRRPSSAGGGSCGGGGGGGGGARGSRSGGGGGSSGGRRDKSLPGAGAGGGNRYLQQVKRPDLKCLPLNPFESFPSAVVRPATAPASFSPAPPPTRTFNIVRMTDEKNDGKSPDDLARELAQRWYPREIPPLPPLADPPPSRHRHGPRESSSGMSRPPSRKHNEGAVKPGVAIGGGYPAEYGFPLAPDGGQEEAHPKSQEAKMREKKPKYGHGRRVTPVIQPSRREENMRMKEEQKNKHHHTNEYDRKTDRRPLQDHFDRQQGPLCAGAGAVRRSTWGQDAEAAATEWVEASAAAAAADENMSAPVAGCAGWDDQLPAERQGTRSPTDRYGSPQFSRVPSLASGSNRSPKSRPASPPTPTKSPRPIGSPQAESGSWEDARRRRRLSDSSSDSASDVLLSVSSLPSSSDEQMLGRGAERMVDATRGPRRRHGRSKSSQWKDGCPCAVVGMCGNVAKAGEDSMASRSLAGNPEDNHSAADVEASGTWLMVDASAVMGSAPDQRPSSYAGERRGEHSQGHGASRKHGASTRITPSHSRPRNKRSPTHKTYYAITGTDKRSSQEKEGKKLSPEDGHAVKETEEAHGQKSSSNVEVDRDVIPSHCVVSSKPDTAPSGCHAPRGSKAPSTSSRPPKSVEPRAPRGDETKQPKTQRDSMEAPRHGKADDVKVSRLSIIIDSKRGVRAVEVSPQVIDKEISELRRASKNATSRGIGSKGDQLATASRISRNSQRGRHSGGVSTEMRAVEGEGPVEGDEEVLEKEEGATVSEEKKSFVGAVADRINCLLAVGKRVFKSKDRSESPPEKSGSTKDHPRPLSQPVRRHIPCRRPCGRAESSDTSRPRRDRHHGSSVTPATFDRSSRTPSRKRSRKLEKERSREGERRRPVGPEKPANEVALPERTFPPGARSSESLKEQAEKPEGGREDAKETKERKRAVKAEKFAAAAVSDRRQKERVSNAEENLPPAVEAPEVFSDDGPSRKLTARESGISKDSRRSERRRMVSVVRDGDVTTGVWKSQVAVEKEDADEGNFNQGAALILEGALRLATDRPSRTSDDSDRCGDRQKHSLALKDSAENLDDALRPCVSIPDASHSGPQSPNHDVVSPRDSLRGNLHNEPRDSVRSTNRRKSEVAVRNSGRDVCVAEVPDKSWAGVDQDRHSSHSDGGQDRESSPERVEGTRREDCPREIEHIDSARKSRTRIDESRRKICGDEPENDSPVRCKMSARGATQGSNIGSEMLKGAEKPDRKNARSRVRESTHERLKQPPVESVADRDCVKTVRNCPKGHSGTRDDKARSKGRECSSGVNKRSPSNTPGMVRAVPGKTAKNSQGAGARNAVTVAPCTVETSGGHASRKGVVSRSEFSCHGTDKQERRENVTSVEDAGDAVQGEARADEERPSSPDADRSLERRSARRDGQCRRASAKQRLACADVGGAPASRSASQPLRRSQSKGWVQMVSVEEGNESGVEEERQAFKPPVSQRVPQDKAPCSKRAAARERCVSPRVLPKHECARGAAAEGSKRPLGHCGSRSYDRAAGGKRAETDMPPSLATSPTRNNPRKTTNEIGYASSEMKRKALLSRKSGMVGGACGVSGKREGSVGRPPKGPLNHTPSPPPVSQKPRATARQSTTGEAADKEKEARRPITAKLSPQESGLNSVFPPAARSPEPEDFAPAPTADDVWDRPGSSVGRTPNDHVTAGGTPDHMKPKGCMTRNGAAATRSSCRRHSPLRKNRTSTPPPPPPEEKKVRDVSQSSNVENSCASAGKLQETTKGDRQVTEAGPCSSHSDQDNWSPGAGDQATTEGGNTNSETSERSHGSALAEDGDDYDIPHHQSNLRMRNLHRDKRSSTCARCASAHSPQRGYNVNGRPGGDAFEGGRTQSRAQCDLGAPFCSPEEVLDAAQEWEELRSFLLPSAEPVELRQRSIYDPRWLNGVAEDNPRFVRLVHQWICFKRAEQTGTWAPTPESNVFLDSPAMLRFVHYLRALRAGQVTPDFKSSTTCRAECAHLGRQGSFLANRPACPCIPSSHIGTFPCAQCQHTDRRRGDGASPNPFGSRSGPFEATPPASATHLEHPRPRASPARSPSSTTLARKYSETHWQSTQPYR